jgi:hypothetical protein
MLPLTEEYYYQYKAGHYQSKCRECARLRQREIYNKKKNDPEFREAERERGKRFRRLQKEKIIENYGGKCECCGIDEFEFLCLDHIHGGGSKHKRELKVIGNHFYKWVIDNNYPKDILRLLCHNCNMAFGAFGYCPHDNI